jgi:perosamine synthetase
MDPVGDVKHTYWMCSILLDDADERDNLRAFLEQNGVESRPTFYPVHTMPMYSHKYQKHANAEYLAYRGINLPSFPAITDEEIDYVIGVIKKFFNER